MKTWSEFLSQQEIQPLQQTNVINALDNTGLLYVGGDDATDFLQNQLSNDIRQIDEKTTQLSSISNAKGRMLGIFRVIKIEGGYLLLLPKSILLSAQQQLQKFIVMSRVVLADITDSFARFSITTDQQSILSTEFLPAEINQVYQSDSLICIRIQSANNQFRFVMLSNNEQEAIDLWSEFSQTLDINDSNNWRLQEIKAGIPTIYPQTVAAFVLQMSNLHITGGVSFKKGCFPGQEVVARMQYLGKLKRRMYLAEIITNDCPEPGDELCTRDYEKADGSGKVVDAVQIEANKCIFLFIAQIAKAEANELVMFKQSASVINLLALPYSFPE